MADSSDSPSEKYRVERDRRLSNAVDAGKVTPEDADLIRGYLNAVDPDTFSVQPQHPDISTVAASSRAAYAKNLRLVATAADTTLATIEVGELNSVMEEMQRELSNTTVKQRQSALRNFYRHHDLEVDPELIYMVQVETGRVDARGPLQREEVDAIRAQFENSRDRAMFDLMLYTGQRQRAVTTLRVKDIDLEENRFYLNTDAAGLKGAKGMRPLLVARDSVGDWMENHPESDDADAYFLTGLPGTSDRDPYTEIHNSTVWRRMVHAAEAAGIDRPKDRAHPHNLRHSFVRWAYVDLDMDVQTIKYMGGWAADSRTFEETYFNILDAEHAAKAEVAADVREEPPESDLTPASCPVCDNVLEAGSKACPACGTVLTPDAKAAQDEIRAGISDEKEAVDELDKYKLLDRLENLADENPELVNRLLGDE